MTNSSLVSVIVPAFNEEDNIVLCVRGLAEALSFTGRPFEILVVNDGSTDGTVRSIELLRRESSSVRVLDLGRNYGKAVALREGLRASRGEIVAFFDADLQYDPRDLVSMAGMLNNGVDVVNGRRDYGPYGLTRTTFSRLYNRILRTLFLLDVNDSNCGLKVLTRNAANPDTLFRYGLPLIVPVLKLGGHHVSEAYVSMRARTAGSSKYYTDGSFLGGWKNIRDILYHSGMLFLLIVSTPGEWKRRTSNTGSNHVRSV